MPSIKIEEAISIIKAGNMVIIVDDEDRENEGDLVVAAEKATPEVLNFMSKHARGLICVPMMAQRLRELRIPMMVQDNTSRLTTSFTVSVDALENTTTGISAHDRSTTVQTLIDPDSGPDDLARPGHIFPLRYTEGNSGLIRAIESTTWGSRM